MNVIITGFNGFIGGNLAEEVGKTRHVIGIDDFSTSSMSKPMPNNTHWSNMSIGTIHQHKDIKTIFHLGIPSSTPLYRNDRHLVGEAISDFIEVLEYCKEHDTKLVWASSSSVYNGYNPPHYEALVPKNTDFYTEARYYMERLAKTYFDFYGVNSIGLRLFSVYGKNDWRKGQYANLITQALIAKQKNQFFKIYGDGTQTRDFTYVKDVVRAFLIAERYLKKNTCDIFNVGTGKETEINYMLELVGLKKKEYIKNPLKNYVDYTCAATTKADKIMGFKAKYDLKSGLKDYLKTENFKEDST